MESTLLSRLRFSTKLAFIPNFILKSNATWRRERKAEVYPALDAFIQDAKRFVFSNGSIIEESPLQAYCSALIFSPRASIIRDTFWSQVPDRKSVV